jgi:hypothetical protein
MNNTPIIFISYSHDSHEHKEWVKELASFLLVNGVDTILDQWDLKLGSDLAKFMEHGLTTSERVLVICTDKYIEKADSGNGGVGYEKMIATTKLLSEQDSTKFIPIVRNVTKNMKLPTFLGSRLYIDLSNNIDTEKQRVELLKEIYNETEIKPAIGNNPFKVNLDSQTNDSSSIESEISQKHGVRAAEVSGLKKLRQGMKYSKAREIILDASWQGSNKRWQEVPKYGQVADLYYKNGWHEIADCAGTGTSPCRFEFHDIHENKLVVITEGECLNEEYEDPKGDETCDLDVSSWYLE